ncbi:type II secretion system protein GspJ [Pseudomonas mosselii]|uniref:type II secretion system protein GspJ n=1 Tax=Pseudomonas mosselii TaxID=78327 RepID=UPI00076FFB96|nr:type II secretion system protein GspJ [Pseudomonas mosselii]AMK31048.1 General secretion pathway protein J [Pseudomonas putida]MBC3453940.1 prepilin-type N-terminal cleavage/methylation domain-containing protein [Pseudomonas mosselii]MDN4500320.1 type II secretion system protein GspJ [Pseudomonas mosselii]MEB5932909.1 prepilin-type N-terminal cleavage/methylation domain-containing protein [Pseudomonas mosselii]ORT66399.1 type II secretion system protein GspJ [Pseudomonas mosselii]
MNRQAGFTLVEVMIAILLMAVVSLVAWRGLDSVSRADRHVREASEDQQAILRVFQQLERDLALRATVELVEPALPGREPPGKPLLPAVRARADRLELVRSGAASGSGLQRVRWYVRGGTLYRAAAPLRERFALPAPKAAVAVLDNVSAFDLRSWQAKGGWRAPASEADDNPIGLEVRLTRRGPQGEERYRQVLGPFN